MESSKATNKTPTKHTIANVAKNILKNQKD